jgi:transglutaminase-like putative cysteine protease
VHKKTSSQSAAYILPYSPGYSSKVGLFQKTKFTGQLGNNPVNLNVNISKPVLYVFSSENPRYMRGSAYTLYEKSSWRNSCDYNLVDSGHSLGDEFDQYVYSLSDSREVVSEKTEVWLADEYRRNIFIPYYAEQIILPAKYIMKNELNMIELPAGTGVYYIKNPGNANAWPLTGNMKKQCLKVNPSLKKDLKILADSVFKGLSGFNNKKAALLNYFQANYKYSKTIDSPEDSDILLNFVFNDRKGHCQLFATAGTLLLRSSGIPARYVEGFLVTDYDSTNKCWFAREGNAHAWIEAWDYDAKSWVVIDPTVAGSQTKKTKSSYIGDFFQRYLFMTKRYFLHSKHMRFTGIITRYAGQSNVRVILLAVIITVLFTAIFFGIIVSLKYIKQKAKRQNGNELYISNLHKLLKKMDKKIRSAGIIRNKTQTIEEFLAKIDKTDFSEETCKKIKYWYSLYAHYRYQPDSDHNRVIELRSFLKKI